MKSRRHLAKGVITIVGALFAAACIAFFAKAFVDALSGVQPRAINGDVLIATALLCPCYGLALLLLAKSWALLLRAAEAHHVADRELTAVYALTQLAKYVPGNVFHLAGRHIALTRKGVAQRALIVSTLHENMVLVISAAVTGSLLVLLFPGPAVAGILRDWVLPPWLPADPARIISALVLFMLTIWAVGASFRRLASVHIYRSIALDGLFFFLQGAFFTVLVYAVTGELHAEAMGVIVLGWIAGFVTPGAPGGAGVREITILLLLEGVIGAHGAVLAAALYRLVTFGGDLLFFGYGALCGGGARPGADVTGAGVWS